MISRGPNFKQIPINIVGSSIFGKFPKISIERTQNLFISDNFLVPYPGYFIGIPSSTFGNAKEGRGIYTATKLNKMIVVMSNQVYLTTIDYNQTYNTISDSQAILIGTIGTDTGRVYIVENNKPQVAISDGASIYIYDPTLTPSFQVATQDGTKPISFVPGYVSFHDTYFLVAATNDTFYSPPATNTWRLSNQNDGTQFPDDAAHIGLLQRKGDSTQAVIPFPSHGNMIVVMGKIVGEPWFDLGLQLFPYQQNNQENYDYGCLSPATVTYLDSIVVWLGVNEKSGPIIMFSTGGVPEKITTDGIDTLFSSFNNPEDSEAFLYRQDGHLIYHINFYKDNYSLFYDFNLKKFYNASDQNLNFFNISQLAFFNNQYYGISKRSGNLFVFDTTIDTFQDVDANGNKQTHEIPRFRACKNIRLPSQEYFIANDIGFTIETGETNYQQIDNGPFNLITQDGQDLITQGNSIFFITQDGNLLVTQDGNDLISQQFNNMDFNFLVTQQHEMLEFTPCVDLSISMDGGASFGNDFRYVLNPIGKRRNKLTWYQLGLANDLVPLFKFWGFNTRVVCTDGVLNIRQ